MNAVKGRHVRVVTSAAVGIVFTIATCIPVFADDDARTGVTHLLSTSADAWNRSRLDEFMTSYENAPTTTLVTSTSILHGYATIRSHYALNYRGAHTGRLTFSDLSIRSLGPSYAIAVARYHLAMRDGTHPSGLFSLVLHRGTSGWKIVTDHSP